MEKNHIFNYKTVIKHPIDLYSPRILPDTFEVIGLLADPHPLIFTESESQPLTFLGEKTFYFPILWGFLILVGLS